MILLIGLLSDWCHIAPKLWLDSLCLGGVGLVLVVDSRDLVVYTGQQRVKGIGCREIPTPRCMSETLSSQVRLIDSKVSVRIIGGRVGVDWGHGVGHVRTRVFIVDLDKMFSEFTRQYG